jgi:hypothetical protein
LTGCVGGRKSITLLFKALLYKKIKHFVAHLFNLLPLLNPTVNPTVRNTFLERPKIRQDILELNSYNIR